MKLEENLYLTGFSCLQHPEVVTSLPNEGLCVKKFTVSRIRIFLTLYLLKLFISTKKMQTT